MRRFLLSLILLACAVTAEAQAQAQTPAQCNIDPGAVRMALDATRDDDPALVIKGDADAIAALDREAALLRDVKAKIVRCQQDELACDVKCLAAYEELSERVASREAVLKGQIVAAQNDLAKSATGDVFERQRGRIAEAQRVADSIAAALAAPGAPFCSCNAPASLSVEWVIQRASGDSVPEVLACIRQLRRDFALNGASKCGRTEAARLARLEQEAFRLGVANQRRISALDERLKKLDPAQFADAEKIVKQRETLVREVGDIKRMLVLPDNEPLLQAFEDYPRHVSKFFAGVEYSAANAFTTDGALPRLGYLAEVRYGGLSVPELVPEAGRSWHFGVHNAFSASLINGAEQSAVPVDVDRQEDVETVLELEERLFFPIVRSARFSALGSRDERLRAMVGPIVVIGARMDGEFNRANARYYGGLRWAVSPDLFIDAMLGKSEPLESWRTEFRGQIPIVRLSPSTRVLIGTIGNFGLQERFARREDRRIVREPDSLRIYLAWETDFSFPFGGDD